jgi:DNA-binding CsgD family transcriptional regulator
MVKGIRELTLDNAKKEINEFNNPEVCAILTNRSLDKAKRDAIIFAHHVGRILHINNLEKTGEIYLHIPNNFSKVIVEQGIESAIRILTDDSHSTGGYCFGITFPMYFKDLLNYEEPDGILVYQLCEPIILIQNDGTKIIASIDKFTVVNSCGDEYFPIRGRVTRDGVFKKKISDRVNESAYPNIRLALPFKHREIDVLQELVESNDSTLIGENLGITASTVEGYRRNIRNISKKIFPDLSDVQLAKKLRKLGII